VSSYTTLRIALVIIASVFACWLVFWTKSAVKVAQSLQGARSQNASEPWYPLWLRFEGIWLWIMLTFLLYKG